MDIGQYWLYCICPVKTEADKTGTVKNHGLRLGLGVEFGLGSCLVFGRLKSVPVLSVAVLTGTEVD